MSDSLFEPIGHGSVSDAVVRQIEELIACGILKEGKRLPSERELSETLNVSRPKLREAIQILEERGLVQSHHGEGTFIAPLTGQAILPALLSLYGRHDPAFFDYLEYRRTQEGFAARLAAERATGPDKERIAQILSDMEQAWERNDADASKERDLALHSAIVDASHNITLIHMMRSIYDLTRQGVFYNRDFLRTTDGSGRQLLDQHLRLGQAVINGEIEEAELAATDHIDFVERSFRIGIERERRELEAKKRALASQ